VRQAARLLAERHGADVQLLDLVDAADGHRALLRDRQAVREAGAVEAGHEVDLRSRQAGQLLHTGAARGAASALL
jgi:hypothetical protein